MICAVSICEVGRLGVACHLYVGMGIMASTGWRLAPSLQPATGKFCSVPVPAFLAAAVAAACLVITKSICEDSCPKVKVAALCRLAVAIAT